MSIEQEHPALTPEKVEEIRKTEGGLGAMFEVWPGEDSYSLYAIYSAPPEMPLDELTEFANRAAEMKNASEVNIALGIPVKG